MTPEAERAIDDALRHGRALLKFISPNDTGKTGSHQAGFYLPKGAWELFSPHPPKKGRLDKAPVRVTWQDGRVTESVVTWYGQETRSEYRLTRFGRDFPWLAQDLVGALLVLIPTAQSEFLAYVIDHDDDIEEVQAALNVWIVERSAASGKEARQRWAMYIADEKVDETADACIDRLFRAFAQTVKAFPETHEMSARAREAVYECIAGIAGRPTDEQVLEFIRNELKLFKLVERKVYQGEVQRLFADIDDFVKTALSILNARKSRAGRALENHIEFLFREAHLPFEMRAIVEGTRPDVLMPGKKEYEDALRGQYPVGKLIMLGLKTTCKDRWRQVLNEAPRIKTKHILTLQEGISGKQMDEMKRSNVVLIVPAALHKKYPTPHRSALIRVETFIATARKILA